MAWHGEVSLWFAAEGNVRGCEDGAWRSVSSEDGRTEFRRKCVEEDFDQAVFHRGARGSGVESDFAKIGRIVKLRT